MRASNWSGRGGGSGQTMQKITPTHLTRSSVHWRVHCMESDDWYTRLMERRWRPSLVWSRFRDFIGVGLDSTTFTSLCCRLRASSWRLVRRTPVSRPSSCHTILSSWPRPFSHRWDCEKPDACTPCWWRSSTRCAAPPWSRSTILRRCSTLRRRGFLVFCVGWCWESDEARLCGRNRAKPNEECRTVD